MSVTQVMMSGHWLVSCRHHMEVVRRIILYDMTSDLIPFPRDWQTWGHFGSKPPAVTDIGMPVFEWALGILEQFYGNEWFTDVVNNKKIPFSVPWDWPLSNPLAVVRLLERACRIAILSQETRDHISAKVHKYKDVEPFSHLDVILETAGMAIRDGWTVEIEVPAPAPSKSIQDIHLKRLDRCEFTIEVTNRGISRAMREHSEWWGPLSYKLLIIGIQYNVCIGGCINQKPNLDEAKQLLTDVKQIASKVSRDEQVRHMSTSFGSIDAYPPTYCPQSVKLSSPIDGTDNYWQAFERRLIDKADQTTNAYDTWMRLDDGSELLIFPQWNNTDPKEVLRWINQSTSRILSGYPHIKGAIISTGRDHNLMSRLDQFTHYVPHRLPQRETSIVMERIIHCFRRRTYIVPMNKPSLIMPEHLSLHPEQWYDREPTWLDWALHKLGQPSSAQIIKY